MERQTQCETIRQRMACNCVVATRMSKTLQEYEHTEKEKRKMCGETKRKKQYWWRLLHNNENVRRKRRTRFHDSQCQGHLYALPLPPVHNTQRHNLRSLSLDTLASDARTSDTCTGSHWQGRGNSANRIKYSTTRKVSWKSCGRSLLGVAKSEPKISFLLHFRYFWLRYLDESTSECPAGDWIDELKKINDFLKRFLATARNLIAWLIQSRHAKCDCRVNIPIEPEFCVTSEKSFRVCTINHGTCGRLKCNVHVCKGVPRDSALQTRITINSVLLLQLIDWTRAERLCLQKCTRSIDWRRTSERKPTIDFPTWKPVDDRMAKAVGAVDLLPEQTNLHVNRTKCAQSRFTFHTQFVIIKKRLFTLSIITISVWLCAECEREHVSSR